MAVGKPAGELTELWRHPLPEMAGRPGRRLCCRSLARMGGSWLQAAAGWEHALPANDPFILAPNHSSRLEAILLPALLALHRHGRQVHFLADWNYFLWPLLGSLMRMNDPVIITRKPARPRFLNVFKPRFQSAETSFQQARRRLLAGQSLGIFPEGTVNRQTRWLLPGRTGAARLSLETGAAVIPMGIRLAGGPSRLLNLDAVMVQMGRPLWPDPAHLGTHVPAPAVRQWHETIMRAIADLSGKSWPPPNPEN